METKSDEDVTTKMKEKKKRVNRRRRRNKKGGVKGTMETNSKTWCEISSCHHYCQTPGLCKQEGGRDSEKGTSRRADTDSAVTQEETVNGDDPANKQTNKKEKGCQRAPRELQNICCRQCMHKKLTSMTH